MRALIMRRSDILTVLLMAFFLISFCPGMLQAGEIPPVDDVINGKAKLPTIEDLTGGKVKIGDLIDKDNADMVKKYLSPGTYELVKRGMVLRMSRNLSPDQIVPKYFREATERHRGKAIMDENGTVYYENMGVAWPGGLPFPHPKTGLEVAANVKFGSVWDDIRNYPNMMMYVDSKGKCYKQVGQDHRFIYCNTRTKVPPLGAIPGYENIMFRSIISTTFPLELKGIGQFVIRHYDDAKEYDTGFAYLPAFKRTIRISATTWQDNIAGSDITYGDGQGLQDPYSDWNFKLVETKYILQAEPKSPFPLIDEKTGKLDKRLRFDVGEKFPRVGWTIWPMYVVEATPKIKHIYGKKVLHTHAWPYWTTLTQFALVDVYDQQMKLWKFFIDIKGNHYIQDGEPYCTAWGTSGWDLQADHATQLWCIQNVNTLKYRPKDISLKALLKTGR
ncbi:MAG: DUF1329 domain-containing protein [Thermodesulfobacteriota bacterium]|nr:DUF1329 domain-containing protein [Thermodesulfobacteriota bacterium]